MIIINSAAYVNSEFINEVGKIPPCFLPLGNKKLLSYQVANLRKSFNEEIYLSLAESYRLSLDEEKIINELGVKVIFIPEDLSLGMAQLYLLNIIDNNDNVVRILHGDTLLSDFPKENNMIGIAYTNEDYHWEKSSNNSSDVWCGYFSFSFIKSYLRALSLSNGDFIKAIHLYKELENPILLNIDGWFDFGHINTYFKSRAAITTQRAFNSLNISDGIVWKSGFPTIKIQAEYEWFKNIPVKLKKYIPQLINYGVFENRAFYELEYLPYLPINELFVHGRNTETFWKKILRLINVYMTESRYYFPNNLELYQLASEDAMNLYETKTYERLKEYLKVTKINLSSPIMYDGVLLPSIMDIATKCIELTLAQNMYPAILHGDLCFSNILYNSRSDSIKVIDPRGMNFNQELTMYGDQKYDLAKLCHSFIGMYDFIISGLYIIEKNNSGVKIIFPDERINNIKKLFLNMEFLPKFKTIDIMPLTILLFISMLPLHSDKPDRQEAMLINALRLYKEFLI